MIPSHRQTNTNSELCLTDGMDGLSGFPHARVAQVMYLVTIQSIHSGSGGSVAACSTLSWLRATEVNRTWSTMWRKVPIYLCLRSAPQRLRRCALAGVRCRRLVMVMTSRDLLCFIELPINLIEASLPVDQSSRPNPRSGRIYWWIYVMEEDDKNRGNWESTGNPLSSFDFWLAGHHPPWEGSAYIELTCVDNININ